MQSNITERDAQRNIINAILEHLISLGNDIYYTPTSDLCSKIVEVIDSKNFLKTEDERLVSRLKAKEIQSLLTYSSNCC